jgi:pSer/pThr/pTyr-binding forkhead associated (FHA) protein
MVLKINVIKGYDKGKTESFSDFPISIGRWEDNDFQLSDTLVSRMHCAIDYRNNSFYVRDLKSANHTIVNDKLVNSELPINNNDIIMVGGSFLHISISNV